MYSILGKRAFDILLSIVTIVILLPVLLLLAIVVRFRYGKPVFYFQVRPGLNNHPFTIIKFRSMNDKRDYDGRLLPDSERLTPFGRFLRSSSLDELPELLNVIMGDMSLVGPRPLLMRYLDRYSPEQMRRHEVKPGITGWAQVNGRNALTWEEKFELDVWYVDNLSLFLDLRIIAKTFWIIIMREGINQPGEATAKEFEGSEKFT